jgi:Zn-finger nucleic acid-binding protein
MVVMQCPVDGTTLAMTERQSVEIDYCPECRGIWLDRGELDRIIEHANAGLAHQGHSGGDGDRRQPRSGNDDGHKPRTRGDGDDDGERKNRSGRKGRFAMLGDLLGGGGDD